MAPTLRIHSRSFAEDELQAWRSHHYSLLKDCPRLLKKRLREKARRRPGRRFFGEAKVLATEHYQDAWYGSFKWLTSSRWSGNHPLSDPYQERFRKALIQYFPELREFQQIVAGATRGIGDRRPVGPDLWLINSKEHRFIEVKLPGDRLRRHQLVGLAFIGSFLRGDRPVSVEVVNLIDHEQPRQIEQQVETEFARICEHLERRVSRPRPT